MASIFGGNITPPVASTQSRLSKIVICMSNGGNTASDKTIGQRSSVSSDAIDPGRKEGGDGNGESVVSSSSSPPKQSTVFPTSTTCSPCSAKEGGSDMCNDGGFSSLLSNASSAAKSPLNPIILKKVLIFSCLHMEDEFFRLRSGNFAIFKVNHFLFSRDFPDLSIMTKATTTVTRTRASPKRKRMSQGVVTRPTTVAMKMEMVVWRSPTTSKNPAPI